MNITFLGGAETVTGSKFLIEAGETRVLVDCGLFQGYKWLRKRNRQPLPLDIESLDAVLLTHAHLDHSGYIPVLYKQGFRGAVYTHHATRDLSEILLADSGHLQEEEAHYLGRHKLSKHETPEPLYDQDDADACMELFQPVDFYEEVQLGDIRFHLRPVGHILGAACIIIETEGKRIGFSGDVGRLNDIFMRPPAPLPALDMLMLESTYGNRRHDDADPLSQLADIVNETVDKGGNILIPAFAVGRAQVLQHMFTTLMKAGRIPVLPIYLDSPMAIDVSEIYCRYEDQHRLSSSECHEMCSTVHYSRSVQDSKALAGQAYPHVIIAGSGMATGGRILHHFKRLLGQHRTTVIFAGYQAGGTRGAKMIGGAERIKIHGDWFPVKARLEVLSGLSGHGDFTEIEQWLAQSDLAPETPINLIHGDPDALEAMKDHLRQNTRFEVDVAGYQSILRL